MIHNTIHHSRSKGSFYYSFPFPYSEHYPSSPFYQQPSRSAPEPHRVFTINAPVSPLVQDEGQDEIIPSGSITQNDDVCEGAGCVQDFRLLVTAAATQPSIETTVSEPIEDSCWVPDTPTNAYDREQAYLAKIRELEKQLQNSKKGSKKRRNQDPPGASDISKAYRTVSGLADKLGKSVHPACREMSSILSGCLESVGARLQHYMQVVNRDATNTKKRKRN